MDNFPFCIVFSTKQPLFVDNFPFGIEFSTKQPLFEDNFPFGIVFSTKHPLFVDNFPFGIVFSTKQPLFMDNFLLNWTATREIGTKPVFGLNIFCSYRKSSYICSPNTEMVLWPSG